MSDELQHPDRADRVLDARTLKALAHPLRVRIYDLLAVEGPQTASTLAARIGETSGATSYHLRALAAHDLIREVPGRGTARERWWERPKGSISVPSPSEAKTPASRATAQIVTNEFFRLRQNTLMEYLNRPDAERNAGWEDAGLFLTTALDLTPEQMAALRTELVELVDRAVLRYRGQDGMPGTQRVSLRTDLFDLPSRFRTARWEDS